MPLHYLAIMVVAGVSLVVLLVHLSGGTVTARLASDADARDRFAEDFPLIDVHRVFRDVSGQNAFLLLGGGDVGIVHAVGDRFLTRIVDAGSIVSIRAERRTPPVLSLTMDDFTWRGGSFEFADMNAAVTVAHALGANNTILEQA